MFEVFAAYLRGKAGMTEEELKQMEALTVAKKLRKHQYLLQEGNVCHHFCFIAKGCLRLYRVGEDGTEHILKFAVENWWLHDAESFNAGSPSQNNIDALEDSEVLLIEKEDLNTILETIPSFKAFKERASAKSYDVSQKRILSNISETAEEKYNNFVKTYPQFYSRIPLHMIASFLGLSRKTLSRVRQHSEK
jgi:CRP-like cAMP-binding protein